MSTEASINPRPTSSAKILRSVMSLGAANAVDLIIQVVVPMVLVRLLAESDFGLYRTLWLLAGTAAGVLALGMPVSLYYFLPRSQKPHSAVFVTQAAIHMAVAGLLAAIGTAVFVMGQSGHETIGLLAVAFIGLWVFASLLDYLYIAQQAAPLQARINLTFAVLRVVLVLGSAYVYRNWSAVLAAHIFLVAGKAVVCSIAIARYTAGGSSPTRASLIEQWKYGLPLGTSTALYLLRGRIDQWLVATLFTAAQFGQYSIAAVFTPIQTLIRVTINQVIQPELSRLQSLDSQAEMLVLNRRSNLAVAMLLLPSIAFIATWAEPVLSVLFTKNFSGAAPVVRIYLLVMAIEAVEVTMILMAMRQGRFMMTVDALVLPIAIASAFAGARLFGMPGAASGAVVGAVIAQCALYWRMQRLTGIPVRQIQDWWPMLQVVVASLLATLVSLLADFLPPATATVLRVMAAGVLFVVGYWLALNALGMTPVVRRVFGHRLSKLVGFGE